MRNLSSFQIFHTGTLLWAVLISFYSNNNEETSTFAENRLTDKCNSIVISCISANDFYKVLAANLISCKRYYGSSKDVGKASTSEGEIILADD